MNFVIMVVRLPIRAILPLWTVPSSRHVGASVRTSFSSSLRKGTKGSPWPGSQGRCFSMGERRRASTKMSLMEMSGFSETQVQVREAVGKICEDFPEVGIFLWLSFL
jgi:hypothetical protein